MRLKDYKQSVGRTKTDYCQKYLHKKSKLAALLLIITISTGCGKSIYLVTGDFQPFIDNFSALYKEPIADLIVEFGDTNYEANRVIGTCYYGTVPRIVINSDFWERSSYYDKQVLLYHELGHCVLGRSHRDDLTVESRPLSIMNSFHIGQFWYTGYMDEYDSELMEGYKNE